MLILFDHVTPRGVAHCLTGHTVTKAKDRGWDKLTNGDLLAEAERAGFDVLLTAGLAEMDIPAQTNRRS